MIRRIRIALTVLSIAFAAALPLWAQDDAEASGDKAGWALGYALVILAIVLGLTVVCRPGSRSSEVRIEQD